MPDISVISRQFGSSAVLANGMAPVQVRASNRGCLIPLFFRQNAERPPLGQDAADGCLSRESPSDKGARLSRDIQAKIGEKLALLYLPVLRQDLPQRLSDLSRRLDSSGSSGRARPSRLSKVIEALRRRERP